MVIVSIPSAFPTLWTVWAKRFSTSTREIASSLKKFFFYAKLLLSVVLIAGIFWYLRDFESVVSRISVESLWPLALLLFVHFLNYFFLGMTYNLPLKIHGLNIQFKEWYGMTVAANLL